MKVRIAALAAGVALCIAVAGCGGVRTELYGVESKPIPAASANTGLYQIEAHINQAASARGWKVDKIQPGELRASQDWDAYTATIAIVFTTSGYSLRYVSSSNLQEGGGRVLNAYNIRVRALESEIDRRLRSRAAPI